MVARTTHVGFADHSDHHLRTSVQAHHVARCLNARVPNADPIVFTVRKVEGGRLCLHAPKWPLGKDEQVHANFEIRYDDYSSTFIR